LETNQEVELVSVKLNCRYGRTVQVPRNHRVGGIEFFQATCPECRRIWGLTATPALT
jgi:hypothetical protein